MPGGGMIGDNPIQRRLAWLHDQWIAFAENGDARILCWQLEEDEDRMVQSFFAMEEDDDVGELPDLFLRFTSPFEDESSYGFALREELIGMSQELHAAGDAELAEHAVWQPPALTRSSVGLTSWVRAAEHFHAHYQLPGHLAIIVNPAQVSDVGAFQRFLLQVAKEAPPQLRLIVLDAMRKPELDALCQGDAKRVVAQPAALDMPRALADASRGAGALDTPGGMFRQLYVMCTMALGRRELAQAEGFAARALAITSAQGWHAMSMPIHMAMAAVLAGEGRELDANARYLAAEQAAIDGERAGDPSCPKLRVQARMARGGMLLGGKAYKPAAELYQETVPLAVALGDARSVIDCQRLASFAREQAGDLRAALNHGVEATQFARNVDFETRKTSTLPFLGEAMQRLAKKSELRAQATRTAKEIEELMKEPSPAAKGTSPSGAPEKSAASNLAPSAPDT